MRRILLFSIIYFSSILAKSQNFASAFEKWDNNTASNTGEPSGSGYSFLTNVYGYTQSQERGFLQSYLDMFKATKDIHYLEKFAIQATRIMERRDDYIGELNPNTGSYNINYGVFAYYVGPNTSPDYIHAQTYGYPNHNTIFGYPYEPSNSCDEYLPDITNIEADANYYLNLSAPYNRGGRSMAWSMDNASVACNQFYQPAMNIDICEEMAEFCFLLYADPDFNGIANESISQNVQEVLNIGNEPYTPTYPADWVYPFNYSTPYYPLTTYGNFADWLYYHVCQACDYDYSLCWGASQAFPSPRNNTTPTEYGYYNTPNMGVNFTPGFAQTNQQCAIGTTLIYLYYYETVVLGFSDANPITAYSQSNAEPIYGGFDFGGQVQNIAQLVYDQLQQNSSDAAYFSNASAWAWVGDESQIEAGTIPEDFEHTYLVYHFVDLCYRLKFPALGHSYPRFTITDMQWLANNFARDMWSSPLVNLAADAVSADSGRWAIAVCAPLAIEGAEGYVNTEQAPTCGYEVLLSQYNPYIYAEVLNEYAYEALYNPLGWEEPIISCPDDIPYSELALFEHASIYDANASVQNGYYYSTIQNIFNPVAVYPDVNGSVYYKPPVSYSYTPIAWSSAASGNYDGSTTSLEFVSSERNTKTIYMNEIQTSDYSISSTYNSVSGTANLTGNITNLTSGNYAGSGNDYVAATDGTYLDIDQKSGSTFSTVFGSGPFNLTFNLSGSWATLTSVKRPDNTTRDAVLAVDENGNGLIYEYTGGTPKIWKTTSGLNAMFNSYSSGGITSGYFDGINNGQEVATADYYGNINIYSLTINNNYTFTFNQVHSWSTLHSQQQINGLASGNFDGSGQDAIITHGATDGCFRIYKVINGNIDTVGFQAFPDGTAGLNEMPDWSGPNYFRSSQWWQMGIMATIKNFPGSPGDALATFRNCDGRIMVFDMQGVCKGQNVSGDYFCNGTFTAPASPPAPTNTIIQNSNNPYFNSPYGFPNNYTLDYNANNILTASNDVVSSGASVQFTAGNTVSLHPGFSALSGSWFVAKIDNSLSCGANQVFHKPVHHAPPSGSVNLPFLAASKSVKKDSLGVQSKPSPTTGQFSVILMLNEYANVRHANQVTKYFDNILLTSVC